MMLKPDSCGSHNARALRRLPGATVVPLAIAATVVIGGGPGWGAPAFPPETLALVLAQVADPKTLLLYVPMVCRSVKKNNGTQKGVTDVFMSRLTEVVP
jgi:hypothetical protein